MKFRKLLLASLLALSITPTAFAETPKEQFQRAFAAYEQKDYYTAFKLFSKLAEQGDAEAQHNLGVLYHYGEGVKQDYQQAFKWYQKAAEQGYGDAQNNLGVMYDNGYSVKQDKLKAKEYFGLACDAGNQKGCDNYRRLNEQGY